MTDRKKLQRLIDRCVKASSAYHLAQVDLNDYCAKIYGTEPGDVDADEIIDDVFGGCGVASGMSAEEFDEIMLRFKTQSTESCR